VERQTRQVPDGQRVAGVTARQADLEPACWGRAFAQPQNTVAAWQWMMMMMLNGRLNLTCRF